MPAIISPARNRKNVLQGCDDDDDDDYVRRENEDSTFGIRFWFLLLSFWSNIMAAKTSFFFKSKPFPPKEVQLKTNTKINWNASCHFKLICKSIICDIPQSRTIQQFSCWQMASCKSSNSAFLTQAAGGWYRLVHNSTDCCGSLHARGTGAQRWNIARNRGSGIPQSARCNFAIASSEASPP